MLFDTSKTEIFQHELFVSYEKKLYHSLAKQTKELRSIVIKELFSLIKYIADIRQDKFINGFVYLLPFLLDSLYVSIKAIWSSADQCIKHLIDVIPSIKILPILLKGCSDSHTIVRSKCAEYTLLYFNHANKTMDNKEQELKYLISILKKTINDSDQKTRNNAHEIFNIFKLTWPNQANKLYETFEDQTKRALEDLKNKSK